MLLSTGTIVTIVLTIVGFLGGAVWGHHGELKRKVNWRDCEQRRKDCHCVKDIEDIKHKFDLYA